MKIKVIAMTHELQGAGISKSISNQEFDVTVKTLKNDVTVTDKNGAPWTLPGHFCEIVKEEK